MDGYQKMCDINKNMTKMGVIKRGSTVSNMLQPKQHVLSFGEILHHGDKIKTNVIHT
jgi:hypothetical protein